MSYGFMRPRDAAVFCGEAQLASHPVDIGAQNGLRGVRPPLVCAEPVVRGVLDRVDVLLWTREGPRR